jgi:NAD(P)-dependent dehydrogenase (short-subunit alcohol dehydrogenase family)
MRAACGRPRTSSARATISGLFDLSGRSALITGATGALGNAAARGLAAAGAKLTITSGRADALDVLADELRGAGSHVAVVARRPESAGHAEAMVQAAVTAHLRLDVVVTAAGLNKTAPTVDMDPADG